MWFDNTKIMIFGSSKISNRLGSLAFVGSLCEMVNGAEKHLKRDTVKGKGHGVSNSIAQVNEDGIKEPGGPNLQLNAILRTIPKIRKAQKPFGDVKGMLTCQRRQ